MVGVRVLILEVSEIKNQKSKEPKKPKNPKEPQTALMPKGSNMPRIKTEYYNNAKVMTELVAAEDDLETLRKNGLRVPIKTNTYVMVDFMDDGNISLAGATITPYDRMVMDAVYTIVTSGTPYFTAETIARTMAGNLDPKRKITQKRLEAIAESVEKMSHVRITVDFTHEYQAHTRRKERLVYKTYLLPIESVELYRPDGKCRWAYHILGDGLSALYLYAQTRHQVINVPVERLITDGVQDTDEAILIKQYLIKRIELLKNPHNQMCNPKIAYYRYDRKAQRDEGLYKEIGLDPHAISRDKRYDIHATVCKILDDFVATGYINGYSESREDQKIVGVVLDVGVPVPEIPEVPETENLQNS